MTFGIFVALGLAFLAGVVYGDTMGLNGFYRDRQILEQVKSFHQMLDKHLKSFIETIRRTQ